VRAVPAGPAVRAIQERETAKYASCKAMHAMYPAAAAARKLKRFRRRITIIQYIFKSFYYPIGLAGVNGKRLSMQTTAAVLELPTPVCVVHVAALTNVLRRFHVWFGSGLVLWVSRSLLPWGCDG
jgi:hypothetical protein